MSSELSHKNFVSKDFSKKDMRGWDLSHSKFFCCNFNDANLAEANCSHCDITGASMIGTNCYNTNFAHSCLACVFHPSDAYGVTWTLTCNTFKGMQPNKLWFLCYLYFATLMKPELDKGLDLRDKVKLVIGAERYLRLKNLFKHREV